MEYRMNLVDIYALLNLCEGKEIVLCGRIDMAIRCVRKLALIGIKPLYFLNMGKNEDAKLQADLGYYGIKTISIKEIETGERPYYFLLTERKGENKQAEHLMRHGYCYLKDFGYFDKACAWGKMQACNSVDPTMGYSSSDYDKTGVKIHGDLESSGLRIGIIGASLADETYFDRKIWTQFLREKMNAQGKNIVEILGASYGYTTSQCLLKLIRDVIPYEPDIVIDYCPVENDCFYGEVLTAPYVVGYQKKMMSLLTNRIKDRFEEKMVQTVSGGTQNSKRTSQVVLDNMKMKKIICDAYGIRYICVFPPSCVTKRVLSARDMTLQWCWGKNAVVTRKVYAEIETAMDKELMRNVLDARGWVDEVEGVFYDQFHMYEEGNQVIAEKLAAVLADPDNVEHFGIKWHVREEM